MKTTTLVRPGNDEINRFSSLPSGAILWERDGRGVGDPMPPAQAEKIIARLISSGWMERSPKIELRAIFFGKMDVDEKIAERAFDVRGPDERGGWFGLMTRGDQTGLLDNNGKLIRFAIYHYMQDGQMMGYAVASAAAARRAWADLMSSRDSATRLEIQSIEG